MKAAQASPTATDLSCEHAAAAVVRLINSRPTSPRVDEIAAVLASAASAPVQQAPVSDLRVRLRKAMANSDAALAVAARLLDGPAFEAAHATMAAWEDEIAAMEREIPHPPRCFEDLVARAEVARHGGDAVDGKLMEAENEESVFIGPAARLVEAVLKYSGADPLAMSREHSAHYVEWRALIAEHMRTFGTVDETLPPEAAKAEERRMSDHLDLIDELAERILAEPARTWGDVRLLAEVTFWAHWSGVDPASADAAEHLDDGPMSHGRAPDAALGKLLLGIFQVAGVGPMGKRCGDQP